MDLKFIFLAVLLLVPHFPLYFWNRTLEELLLLQNLYPNLGHFRPFIEKIVVNYKTF